MVKKEIDYEKYKSEAKIVFLKENETVRVKFLDNGVPEDTEITDKNSNIKKVITKFVYEVIDLSDNQKKELSTLSTRLIRKLGAFYPLKDKSLSIRKFKFGNTDFDVDFQVEPL